MQVLGWPYRARRVMAKQAGSVLALVLVTGIFAGMASLVFYLWAMSAKHDRDLVRHSEELRHMQARLGDIGAIKQAALACQVYAYASASAAMAVHADVGALERFTRVAWEKAAKRHRFKVPDFEPELMCNE